MIGSVCLEKAACRQIPGVGDRDQLDQGREQVQAKN